MKKLNIYKSYKVTDVSESHIHELMNHIMLSFDYVTSKSYEDIYVDCFDNKGNIIIPSFIVRGNNLSEKDVISYIKIYERIYKIDKLLDNNI